MSDAYLHAAARTPFGRFGGALAGVRPGDPAATALTGQAVAVVLENVTGEVAGP
ncbi:hypothetical protein [Streptomyces sp. NPDC052292]|uniref:hypothetical protein n=1 Tax=Streptomyces sp. NPDC052292 TaxID=3155053 RepID=UPI00342E0139